MKMIEVSALGRRYYMPCMRGTLEKEGLPVRPVSLLKHHYPSGERFLQIQSFSSTPPFKTNLSTTASTVFFFLLSRFSISAVFVISPLILSLVNPEALASSISSLCSPFRFTKSGTQMVSLEPESFFKSVLTILSADCCSTGASHL